MLTCSQLGTWLHAALLYWQEQSLTKKGRQSPSLQQYCLELEWDGKETNDDIRQGQVGDVHVGHGSHPLEYYHVDHQDVPCHGYEGSAHIERDEKCVQDTGKYK